MLTPYQFASNRPIDGIDLDGLEFFKANYYRIDLKPVISPPNKVYATVHIDPYTQSIDHLQRALAFEQRLRLTDKKTTVDGIKSLVSLGLEFKNLGISNSSGLGRSLGTISRVNALFGVYDEFKKAYDKGKLQGEALNYSIVQNLLTRDFKRAEWVVNVIATAQSRGLISGDKEYLEQLTAFSLKGEIPMHRNGTFSFIVNEGLYDRLLADFEKLETLVTEDAKKIYKVDLGNGKSQIHDLRELEPKPE